MKVIDSEAGFGWAFRVIVGSELVLGWMPTDTPCSYAPMSGWVSRVVPKISVSGAFSDVPAFRAGLLNVKRKPSSEVK